MDDLAMQFAGTAAGKRFVEAWKRAYITMWCATRVNFGHSGRRGFVAIA